MKPGFYALKQIRVTGISFKVTTCECCGRSDLSKTVVLQEQESGRVLHFGSTCAVNANKYDSYAAAKLAGEQVKKALYLAKQWNGVNQWQKERSMRLLNKTEEELFNLFVTTGTF
jgi:predicted metal-binding protein